MTNRPPGDRPPNRPSTGQPGSEHPEPALVLDLALGHLTGPERDPVVAHLADCPVCRADLDALSVAVEVALPAVPRAEPSPGFTSAVLDRLGVAGPGSGAAEQTAGPGSGRDASAQPPSATPSTPSTTSRRLPAWVGIAAAGLIGLGAGAGLTAALGDGVGGAPATEPPVAEESPTGDAPPEEESGPEVSSGVALVTGDGERVGTVSRSWSEGAPMLVVDVTSGEPGRSYLCRLRMSDGTTEDVGRWTLDADRPNSWVIPDPGATEVDLVAESGAVWSTATL